MGVTHLEREVIDAAKAAVRIEAAGKVTTANLTSEAGAVERLVRAVYRLVTDTGYWRES